MTSEIRFPTPVETAIEYVRTYNAHDPIRLRNLYHASFGVENPLWEGKKGIDEAVSTLQRVWDALPGARFDLRNVLADGNTVLIEFDFVWDDLQDDGKVIERRLVVADVIHVIDGKMAALRAYMNSEIMHSWLRAREV